MKRRTYISAVLLLSTLVLVAYLDSPYSILNKNYSYTAGQPATVEAVNTEPPTDLPELMEKKVKSEKVGDYIVETYEEYEIHRDKDGKIIDHEPTGKTETLRYWNYNQKTKKDQ
ncbi:hypothetical protein [Bacillus sp. JJ1764]|uniref:hypothetical protein n=1 Tax=Bacillus sp. JJ1764 TaxID=3122964 RepID=UPI002FFE51A2